MVVAWQNLSTATTMFPTALEAQPTACQFDGLSGAVKMRKADVSGLITCFNGRSPMRLLTAIPVYNEERHLLDVLREVRRYSPQILIVNDGSTDGTAALLARQRDIHVVTHPHNRGYGAALMSAFTYALAQPIDVLVTTD